MLAWTNVGRCHCRSFDGGFTRTLYQIDSRPEQRDDFILFGDILLEIFPALITDIDRDYNTDVEDLLGDFLGDWVDRLTSEGTMTTSCTGAFE